MSIGCRSTTREDNEDGEVASRNENKEKKLEG